MKLNLNKVAAIVFAYLFLRVLLENQDAIRELFREIFLFDPGGGGMSGPMAFAMCLVFLALVIRFLANQRSE